ncbi:FAD binding domain-containing protein, partial [Aeromonas finlandensis]|uniref:FAD binding domain-containing protein n=1 Tax=Aeromonas finlandensis TaxID=1543375 RepID=UPI00051C5E74
MKPVQFNYCSPKTLAEAWEEFLPDSVTKWLGGGQSLGPMLNLRLARPNTLVQLSGIEELTHVEITKQYIRYGAMSRHADFEDGKLPDITGHMLQNIAAGIAYRAVRNRGTIGGSLAHADPAADWLNAMVALDAKINITGKNGKRSVTATEFMLAAFTTVMTADEVIVSVDVPRLSDNARWGYSKYCRKPGELSEATATVVVDPDRGYARIVLGALHGAPVPLEELADILAQKGLDTALEYVEEIVTPYVLSMSEYRRKIYAVIVKKALMQLRG